jgi:hypothetical protein
LEDAVAAQVEINTDVVAIEEEKKENDTYSINSSC